MPNYFVTRGPLTYYAHPLAREGEPRRWAVIPNANGVKAVAEIKQEGDGVFVAHTYATLVHPGTVTMPVGSIESAIEAALDALGIA